MKRNQYSIHESIQEIYDILNHWTNVSVDGQPPYSPLPEESVLLLKEQLERLKKCLTEMENVRKEELKLAGLKEEDESYRLKPIQIDGKCRYLVWKTYKYPTEHILLEPTRFEPILLEPTRFEPILLEPTRFEPKLLKKKPHKNSDGWRTPNKNQRKPVCRY